MEPDKKNVKSNEDKIMIYVLVQAGEGDTESIIVAQSKEGLLKKIEQEYLDNIDYVEQFIDFRVCGIIAILADGIIVILFD